jgi:hypothetical protein
MNHNAWVSEIGRAYTSGLYCLFTICKQDVEQRMECEYRVSSQTEFPYGYSAFEPVNLQMPSRDISLHGVTPCHDSRVLCGT